MKSKFKKIMSICLSMALAFSLALPVYAGSAISGSISSNYEFDEATGHLTIGKVIEKKSIFEINSIPQDKIKSVTIRDGVTKIGGSISKTDDIMHNTIGAFWGCTSLTSVTIPDSVTEICDMAFSDCTGLTSVTIGNGVKKIGESAFEGCTGLTSITIPNSVDYIGKDAFLHCISLTSINVDTENQCYKSVDGVLFSKDGKTLLKFPTRKRETNYTISNSVESIGSSAFQRCTGLTSITIPNSVTSIGNGAFQRCTDLTSITIPNSVTRIGLCALSGCTGLTSITIPDSVKEIDSSAFEGCTGLTSVTIPDSVTSIDWDAFKGCTGLTSITIPDGVTKIGSRAFSGCTGLTSITIPNSVTSIGNDAFRGCTGLTSITICSANAFDNRTDFEEMLESCEYSGKMAVMYYKSLEDENYRVNAFNGCTNLKEVTIPKELDITRVLFNKNVKINRI